MTGALPAAFADPAEDVFRLIERRLARTLPDEALGVAPTTGDHILNAWAISGEFLATTRAAAVLVGLVPREGGLRVLLTQRTSDLRDHGGQIAFPGGKIDPSDASAAAAAIREANEEVGLPPAAIHVIGYLDPYLSRTGFRIVPVVARVEPPFELTLNAAEVVDAFEVPFAYLMDVANHRICHREWLGAQRAFYVIEHGGRTIWGITAGILRVLHDRLYL